MAPYEGSAAAHPEQGLLSLLAHDLRTPLGPLGLAVTSLAEDASVPASVRELGSMAQAQGQRLARLIDATLAASGRLPFVRMRCVPLSSLLDDVAARFGALGGRVDAHAPDLELECDPDRLRDALLGVLEVAAGEGGAASLEARESDGRIRFDVPARDPAACRRTLGERFVSSAESAFLLGARAVLRVHDGDLSVDDSGMIGVVPVRRDTGGFDPGW